MNGIDVEDGDNDLTKKLKLEMQRAKVDDERLPVLMEVTEEAEQSPEHVDEELMKKAKKLIEVLSEKKALNNAISKKEIAELQKTLKRIESKGLKEKLRDEFDQGSKLLSRLQTNERMRHEVK